MPNKIKTIIEDEIEITLWETNNISITTSKAVVSNKIESLLLSNKYPIPHNFKNFIYAVNKKVEQNERKSFLFINKESSHGYLEYLCNYAYIRIYNNELKVEIALGLEATFENIIQTLQQLHINYGIQEEAIRESIKGNIKGFFVAAIGKETKPITPRQYTYHYLTQRPIPISIRQNDKVSFLDFTTQNTVIKNDEILSYIEAIPGENGHSVTGFIIPENSEAAPTVFLGDNVEEKDGVIVSTISGMVAFDKNLISVAPVLTYSKKPASNIVEFDGTVVFFGNVNNLRIKASKDVIIHGSCQNCVVEAAGFAYFFSGITGKSKIEAVYDIFTRNVYTSNLISISGNIYIAHEAFHSNLKAKGPIIIENKISGGSAESSCSIKVQIAGAEKTKIKTILSLSLDPSEKNKIEQANIELKKLAKQYIEITSAKKNIETIAASKQTNLLENVEYQKLLRKENLMKEGMSAKKDLIFSAKSFLDDRNTNMITVCESICQGTVIYINDDILEINYDNFASTFSQGSYGILRSKYEPS